MENPFNTQENTPQKRSTLLTILLVLTFIWSGLNFVSNAFVAIAFDMVIEVAEDRADDEFSALAPVFEQVAVVAEKMGPIGYAVTTLLYFISLFGASLMWRLNKRGFHLYASAQIVILFIPMIFGLARFPGIGATLIAALFIWLYSRELKIFDKPNEN